MKSKRRRLKHLESGLRPKQAMLLWLQDAQRFTTITDYVQHMKTEPDSHWPLIWLPNQVTEAVEIAMGGKPRDQTNRAVRQAVRDVFFLFKMCHQMNFKFLEEQKYLWTRARLVASELEAMERDQALRDQRIWDWVRVSLELPYPLDEETAASITQAQTHHVLAWGLLEEGDNLHDWVLDSFVAEGRTILPEEAYLLRDQSESGDDPVPTLDEVRDQFKNVGEFQSFMADTEYSYGLADVSDAEYEERYSELLEAVKCVVQTGTVVTLPSVPHRFLREAPLVENEWIDRHVVALAEWGARACKKGYLLKDPEDFHPMAWCRVVDPEDGSTTPGVATEKLWQQTAKHLTVFPGRTREIEGRPYLSFTDYAKWRGRLAEGDLTEGLHEGITIFDWNRWVDVEGDEGEATLAGIKVGKLSCYLDRYRNRVCQDAAELQSESERRSSLLRSLRAEESESYGVESFRRRVREWKDQAEDFLTELYSLRQANETIGKRYFDGRQVLFNDEVESIVDLVSLAENLVEFYNEVLAVRFESHAEVLRETRSEVQSIRWVINLADVTNEINRSANDRVAYVVDMAKAEALSLMGETEKAMKFADRHLQPAGTIGE